MVRIHRASLSVSLRRILFFSAEFLSNAINEGPMDGALPEMRYRPSLPSEIDSRMQIAGRNVVRFG